MWMRARLIVVGAIVSAIGFAAAAEREKAGDPAEGHRLAIKICGFCHIAASDQEFAPTLRNPVPSFQTIANKPGTTTAALRQFLLTTHSTIAEPNKMPNPRLTDDQITDVVSYIVSLRPRRAP